MQLCPIAYEALGYLPLLGETPDAVSTFSLANAWRRYDRSDGTAMSLALTSDGGKVHPMAPPAGNFSTLLTGFSPTVDRSTTPELTRPPTPKVLTQAEVQEQVMEAQQAVLPPGCPEWLFPVAMQSEAYDALDELRSSLSTEAIDMLLGLNSDEEGAGAEALQQGNGFEAPPPQTACERLHTAVAAGVQQIPIGPEVPPQGACDQLLQAAAEVVQTSDAALSLQTADDELLQSLLDIPVEKYADDYLGDPLLVCDSASPNADPPLTDFRSLPTAGESLIPLRALRDS